MATKEEIERVARLMRIELDDHTVHIDRVQKMIDYFDILDRADTLEGGISAPEMPIDRLRQDRHVPFDVRLLDYLKAHKGGYVRAPGMI